MRRYCNLLRDLTVSNLLNRLCAKATVLLLALGFAVANVHGAEPVAVISARHVVFRSGSALYRYDFVADELLAETLLATDEDSALRVTSDGRAVVYVSTRGPMIRASARSSLAPSRVPRSRERSTSCRRATSPLRRASA